MRLKHWIVPCLLLLGAGCATPPPPLLPVPVVHPKPVATLNPEQTLTRIAFGSCNRQNLPQPLWKRIIADHPDLFLWTGDVVYADTGEEGRLSQIYMSQIRQPEYENFLNAGIPVLGVYDDHDYGQNNGGKDFKDKKTTQKFFLDFLGEAETSARRKQEGIYSSYTIGKAGQRVRIILLDTRYHREAPGPTGDLLGKDQWAWLEKEIQAKDADLKIVVSSIQILSAEHDFEKWANFPASHQRLLKLLEPEANILLISGDRHLAEISKYRYPSGHELWDITSSGLTHSFQNPDEKRNRNSLRQGRVYDRLNYGLLTIDWKKATVRAQIRSLNGDSVLESSIPFRP